MKYDLVLLPRGGLGNQLHQFVLAFQLCQSGNQSIVIDARHLPRQAYDSRTGVTLRPFALDSFDNFNIQIRYSKSHLSHLLFRFKLEAERLLLRRFPGIARAVVTLDEVSPADFWSSNPRRISSLLGKLEISPEALKISRKFFEEPKSPSKSFRDIKQLTSAENIVGVHVRRGDYTKLGHLYGEISEQWYLDGLESVLRDNQKALVFSDSAEGLEFLTRKFGEERVMAVGPEKISNPVEVLSLLASCSSLVLSNSTLSWWSMALGESFEKVLYPTLEEGFVQVFDREKLPSFVSAEFMGRDIY